MPSKAKKSSVWTEFIKWMADEEGATGQEWKGICVKKYGWSLRLKQKSCNVVYLGPGRGCFMVSFVLSDKGANGRERGAFAKDRRRGDCCGAKVSGRKRSAVGREADRRSSRD